MTQDEQNAGVFLIGDTALITVDNLAKLVDVTPDAVRKKARRYIDGVREELGALAAIKTSEAHRGAMLIIWSKAPKNNAEWKKRFPGVVRYNQRPKSTAPKKKRVRTKKITLTV